MKEGKSSCFRIVTNIFLIVMILTLSVPNAYAFDWNPLNWLKSEIVPKNKYTLVFWKRDAESVDVYIRRPTNDYQLVCKKESGEEQVYNCNDIKEIIENNVLKSSGRVGLATLIAGGAMAAITGGVAIPILLAAGLGGGASYMTRGISPKEFCHN